MQIKTLDNLYRHELADIYAAEQQLIEALPKLAEAANPRWTGQKRPNVDGSKAANDRDPGRVVFYSAVASACNKRRVRKLRGPHLRTWAWCNRRSSIAVTAATSPRSLPQSSTGRFEVMRVAARS